MPTLHRIDESHRAQLTGLFRRNNVPSVTRFFHPFPLGDAQADHIAASGRQDRYYLFLHEDEAVGFSMLRGWDEGYAVPSLGMFVDVGRQGVGLGRALLLATLEEARQLACAQVRLSVYADNAPALRLYADAGFEIRETRSVASANGPRESLVMILDLRKAP